MELRVNYGFENTDKTMKIQKTKLKEIGVNQNEDDKVFQWKKDHLVELTSNSFCKDSTEPSLLPEKSLQ